MAKTDTQYIVVGSNSTASDKVAKLLDEGYTLVASWTTKIDVHHLLTKALDEGND